MLSGKFTGLLLMEFFYNRSVAFLDKKNTTQYPQKEDIKMES